MPSSMTPSDRLFFFWGKSTSFVLSFLARNLSWEELNMLKVDAREGWLGDPCDATVKTDKKGQLSFNLETTRRLAWRGSKTYAHAHACKHNTNFEKCVFSTPRNILLLMCAHDLCQLQLLRNSKYVWLIRNTVHTESTHAILFNLTALMPSENMYS